MKSKEKLIYIILGLIIVIAIIVTLFIYNSKMAKKTENTDINYSYKIEDAEFSSIIQNEIVSKGFGADINYLTENSINGTIDKDIGGGVLTTEGIFSYDNSNLTTKYFDFKGLVINYFNYNNKVYYIKTDEDTLANKWQLIENNEELNSPKVLMSGDSSGINGDPVLFMENNNLYFMYADDTFKNDVLTDQKFAIYQINDEMTKTELLNYPNNDEYVVNLESNNHYNNNYYYQTKNGNKYNLYTLDLSTMNTNLLQTSDSEFDYYLSLKGKDAFITKRNQFDVYDEQNNINNQKNSYTDRLYRISDSKLLINGSDDNYIYDANTNTIKEIDLGKDFTTYSINPYMDNKLLLQANGEFKILTIEY